MTGAAVIVLLALRKWTETCGRKILFDPNTPLLYRLRQGTSVALTDGEPLSPKVAKHRNEFASWTQPPCHPWARSYGRVWLECERCIRHSDMAIGPREQLQGRLSPLTAGRMASFARFSSHRLSESDPALSTAVDDGAGNHIARLTSSRKHCVPFSSAWCETSCASPTTKPPRQGWA